jgi:hypothetical protein
LPAPTQTCSSKDAERLVCGASYGDFYACHPGHFAVGVVILPGGTRVTLVSLYGLWDKMHDDSLLDAESPCWLLRPRRWRSVGAGDWVQSDHRPVVAKLDV